MSFSCLWQEIPLAHTQGAWDEPRVSADPLLIQPHSMHVILVFNHEKFNYAGMDAVLHTIKIKEGSRRLFCVGGDKCCTDWGTHISHLFDAQVLEGVDDLKSPQSVHGDENFFGGEWGRGEKRVHGPGRKGGWLPLFVSPLYTRQWGRARDGLFCWRRGGEKGLEC